MFESNIVRLIFIPIYIVIASITVFLIWKNSAANDSLKNSGIALASLLPVLIAVLPYINLRENNRNMIMNLIYDSETKYVITGEPSTPYDYAYISVFSNLPEEFIKAEKFNDLLGQKGLDLIEKGIINELLLTFSSHWDFETTKQTTPIGINTYRSHSNEKFKKLTLEDVIKLFPHNKIINTEGILVGNGLALPPNSKISTSVEDNKRTITITNDKVKTTIQIIPSFGSVIQKGIDGIVEPDPGNMNRYYIISFNVKLNFQPKRFEQFSPEMEKYKKWFNNIAEILKRMTWDEVAEKNKQRLLDNAVNKILNTSSIESGTSTKKEIKNNEQQWKQVNIP